MKTRLSISMIVRDCATTLARCLKPFHGIADEIVYWDTGSRDSTVETIEELGRSLQIRTVAAHPHPSHDDYNTPLFFPDDPSSFRNPPSYWDNSYTGLPILADWGEARNISLDACTSEYVIRMDGDDECLIPENILPTMAYLDTRPDIDLVSAPYEIYKNGQLHMKTMFDRLWRRVSKRNMIFLSGRHTNLHWARSMHEHLVPKISENTLLATTGLLFRDWRDNPGVEPHIKYRNSKVLWRVFNTTDSPPPMFFLTLGRELLSDGDYDGALRFLDRALSDDSSMVLERVYQAEIFLLLAQAIRRGNLPYKDRALAALNRSIAFVPGFLNHWERYQMTQTEDDLKTLERMVVHLPDWNVPQDIIRDIHQAIAKG